MNSWSLVVILTVPSGFLNFEYVEQKTFRSEQRRNPREIILECLSEGRDTGGGDFGGIFRKN